MSTYVFVHGICHGGWCWERTAQALEQRGHRTVALDLPLTSLADDAEHVVAALDGLAEPVILVGHSYGGLVISRAAADRADVEHLVYVAAVLVDGSDSYLEQAGAFPRSPLVERITLTDDGQIVVPPDAAIDGFYNTCQPADAAAAAARLRPTAAACLATPPEGEPWRTTPSTYVLCEQDRAVPPEMQRWMATRAGQVLVYDTDHSPFLSMHDRFVDDLDGLAVRA
jgi:pimeloyl-ACP methyl ester carboxylesterase